MFPRPKDYLVVDNKLFFAVVSDLQEDNRVLTMLRYIKTAEEMQKLDSQQAYQTISSSYPEYKLHSQLLDIELHGIPLGTNYQHLQPEHIVARLLGNKHLDKKQEDAVRIISLLIESGIDKTCLGITGSLMLETHNDDSDIDVVVYGREHFFKVRECIKKFIATGELGTLDKNAWLDSWQRRDCELNFDEYYLHEKRKFNKCISGNSKVDISMIPKVEEKIYENPPYKKIAHEKIIAQIIDDTYSYDFPARFKIDSDVIGEVVTYTATYTGQAKQGETIEAAGYIEEDKNGNKHLLVGTSREAQGEYIKIINE